MPKEESEKSVLAQTENIIRMRAYQLFEERGYQDGHDLDDWLQAEAEVTGQKPIARADQSTSLHEVAAA
jgi:Protein of unknown function (DUF2934)